ncbi:hypothetical protein CKAH01_10423 [Colletotrichum kahawae]|uniref:Uncharacterized protein n=1 Tax=Colletotrichum kahawae TaxID=34407 RepID=A0AAD9XW08_COLKA|nr:hypothetical protein CKAH01_10423 [Colletotrichum kahawae]
MVACQWRDIVSQSNARRNAGTSRSTSAYGDELQRPDDPRAAASNELVTDSFSSHMPCGRVDICQYYCHRAVPCLVRFPVHVRCQHRVSLNPVPLSATRVWERGLVCTCLGAKAPDPRRCSLLGFHVFAFPGDLREPRSVGERVE